MDISDLFCAELLRPCLALRSTEAPIVMTAVTPTRSTNRERVFWKHRPLAFLKLQVHPVFLVAYGCGCQGLTPGDSESVRLIPSWDPAALCFPKGVSTCTANQGFSFSHAQSPR